MSAWTQFQHTLCVEGGGEREGSDSFFPHPTPRFWQIYLIPKPTGGCLHPQFFRPSAGTESCILAHFERSNFWLYNTFRSGPCHSDLFMWNLILKQSHSGTSGGKKWRYFLKNKNQSKYWTCSFHECLSMFGLYNFRMEFFIAGHCESKGVRLAGKIESN